MPNLRFQRGEFSEMNQPASQEITQLLLAWGSGDKAALDALMPIVYDELRKLAKRYMRRQNPDHTLQTTALVNEAYLRLIDSSRVRWQDRTHFFAISAQLMRRILVDFARAKNSRKRGGEQIQITLDERIEAPFEKEMNLVALDEALQNLAKLSQRQSQIVELRYFGGLSEEEISETMEISTRTVRRDWSLARAWLYRELNQG
ncbi:MAG TPA: sigma-70 family RNA polymerase sigma factor [Pyrinomonadaceae bacterium]|jgi:RNA polymerase sigma factor (TIGR02999 family)